MTDALDRIEADFNSFRSKLGECRQSNSPEHYQDAYGRFGRMVEGFDREAKKGNLSKSELAALQKVFRSHLIESVMEIWQVSKYVERRNDFEIQTHDGSFLAISQGASALSFFPDSMFSGGAVMVPGPNGHKVRVEHLAQLEAAALKIEKAFATAKS